MKSIQLLLLAIITVNVQAQNLDLFQNTESSANRSQPAQNSTRQESNKEPAFTLVGTSRFGDEYYASLLSREGKKYSVTWEKGKLQKIEGKRNYYIAAIKSRGVSIRLPDNESCIENEAKGVRCNNGLMILSLSNMEPVEIAREDLAEDDLNPESISEINGQSSGVLPRNPFSGEIQENPDLTEEERAARQARRQRRAELYRDFEIVRIPDDEIPEGMRRLRTPFGDSLEPIED